MPYIGKSPTGTGVRQRYYFTATGGETSLSGADDNSNTLVFSDGNYVDVSLNGIALVAGTDYNTSTANTIGGLSALSASDIVEIVVYDIFGIADTVSAKDGGTFSGNVAMGGTLSVTGASTLTGAATATGGLNVGTIKEVTGTTTAMTVASSGIVTNSTPVGFAVDLQANQSGLADNTYSLVEFQTGGTFSFDTHSGWSNSDYYYTVPNGCGGYWLLTLFVELDVTASVSAALISKTATAGSTSNGIARALVAENTNTSSNCSPQVTTLVNLSDGDIIKGEVYHSYGDSRTAQGSTDVLKSSFQGWRIF